MNAPQDAVKAACVVAFRHLFPELPAHGAVAEYLEVSIPEKSFLDAHFPRAVGGSTAEVVPRVVAACVEALSQGVHGRAMGSGGGATYLILQGKRGDDPYRMCVTLGSGGGASGKGDGLNNGDGSTRFTCFQDLEGLERQFPLRILKYGLRSGSGGAGRYLGGSGCELIFEMLEGPSSFTLFGDRYSRGPGGTHRGTRGHTSQASIWRNGHWQELPQKTKVEALQLNKGDRVRVATAGGGGYGHPFERAIRLVSGDVRSGHLSRRDAALRHGVLFSSDDAKDYDSAQTFKLRSYRLTAADVEGILDEIEDLDDTMG
jgi:N-methylhydantoinase B